MVAGWMMGKGYRSRWVLQGLLVRSRFAFYLILSLESVHVVFYPRRSLAQQTHFSNLQRTDGQAVGVISARYTYNTSFHLHTGRVLSP